MKRIKKPMILVAASDSLDEDKAKAQYLCDGVDDEVEIQAAINTAVDMRGNPQLLRGTFFLGDTTINVPKTIEILSSPVQEHSKKSKIVKFCIHFYIYPFAWLGRYLTRIWQR